MGDRRSRRVVTWFHIAGYAPPVPKRTRSQRRRAGAAGGRAYNGVGQPSAGPAGAPISPDELVFGTAAQLRAMAETLRRGDRPTLARQAAASAGRVTALRHQHPTTDLATLVGRPICEATDTAPRVRVAQQVRFQASAGDGNDVLMIDGPIMSAVDDWFGEGVSAQAVRAALREIGTRDITVHVNSRGGDFFEGVAIYQALLDHPGNIYVAVVSLAASAASIIALAGDTIGVGTPLARIMIHDASALAYGNAADMLKTADMLDNLSGGIAESYAAAAAARGVDTSAERFRELMVEETFFDADAAIAIGLADETLDMPAGETPDGEEDAGEADEAVAALFSWAQPRATIPAPPAREPDPAHDALRIEPTLRFADLFDDDLMELTL